MTSVTGRYLFFLSGPVLTRWLFSSAHPLVGPWPTAALLFCVPVQWWGSDSRRQRRHTATDDDASPCPQAIAAPCPRGTRQQTQPSAGATRTCVAAAENVADRVCLVSRCVR